MSFTGTVADINAALEGLAFTPDAAFAGDVLLTITTDDLGNSGPGGPQTDSDTVEIIVLDNSGVAPVANAVSATRDIGQTATIDALAAASDPLSRPLTLSIDQDPAGGSAAVDDAGTPADPSDDFITYTANPGYNGDDSFTYRVSTDVGSTATATVTVTTESGVAIDQDPDDPSKTALFIVGTDAAEQIKVARKKTQLRVLINKVQQNDLFAMPTGGLVVIAKGGDDKIAAGPLKNLPQRLYGGDGNDTLTGGKAADVIVGGAGVDKIKGGGGNDFIAAGDGADTASGAAGDDVIASGGGAITTYSGPNAQAIRDLMNAWAAGTDYQAKVTAITVTGVGDGPTTLGASTLSDDADLDTVNGSSGNDVFFVNTTGGTIADKLKKTTTETAVDL
jgi:Ca2+-binding RTX toxin-like protein